MNFVDQVGKGGNFILYTSEGITQVMPTLLLTKNVLVI